MVSETPGRGRENAVSARASRPLRRFVDIAGYTLMMSIFFVFPLAVNVTALWRPIETNFFLYPKLWVLGLACAVGFTILLLSFQTVHLTTLPRHLLRAPASVKWILSSILILFASTFWSSHADPVTSILGSTSLGRFDGAFLFSASFLMFFACSRLAFIDPHWLRRAVVLSSIGAIIVGLVAALQVYGVDVWSVLGFQGSSSLLPSSTLGHPSLVSAFTGTMGGIALGAFLYGNNGDLEMPHSRWLILATVLAVLTVIAGGRAGLLAFVFVAVLVSGVHATRQGLRPRVHGFVLVFLIVGFVLPFLVGTRDPGTSVEGARAVLQGEDTSLNSRLVTWQLGLEALRRQPVRPYGVGGFSGVVWDLASADQERKLLLEFVAAEDIPNVYREGNALLVADPERGLRMIRATYDKAHNYVLDLWLSFGLVAAIAYFSTVLVIAARIFSSGPGLPMAILVGIAVYAIFGQAWFPTSNLEPIVWGLTGCAWGSTLRQSGRAREMAMGS